MKTVTHAAGEKPEGSTSSYVTGFLLALLLTIMPFLMVYYHTVHGLALIAVVIFFALLQLMIQMEFFMHLGAEQRPRWKSMSFLFMIVVVLTVVVGSLWIMHNLDYNMTPEDMQKHIQTEDDL